MIQRFAIVSIGFLPSVQHSVPKYTFLYLLWSVSVCSYLNCGNDDTLLSKLCHTTFLLRFLIVFIDHYDS